MLCCYKRKENQAYHYIRALRRSVQRESSNYDSGNTATCGWVKVMTSIILQATWNTVFDTTDPLF